MTKSKLNEIRDHVVIHVVIDFRADNAERDRKGLEGLERRLP